MGWPLMRAHCERPGNLPNTSSFTTTWRYSSGVCSVLTGCCLVLSSFADVTSLSKSLRGSTFHLFWIFSVMIVGYCGPPRNKVMIEKSFPRCPLDCPFKTNALLHM